ncbi:MAG: four helix bundle protein [Bacteroides sp.]|nr:four helix bundle protein [Bacteroides sp.]
MSVFNYERLQLWQKSRTLVRNIYLLTRDFPVEEKYALTDQIRRAVISISSNIAEGSGRISDKEKLRFLSNAYGSLTEVSCQLTLAHDIGIVNPETMQSLRIDIEEIGRMMSGYRNFIIKRNSTVTPF